jgi:predicted DNA-binding transcriptional regulator AlpA
MLSTSALAAYLGVSSQAIYDLRCAGRGPRAIRVGRELRYRVSEVRAWLDRLEEAPTLEQGARHVR